MTTLWRIIAFCLLLGMLPLSSQAQLPPHQPEQDCFNAIPLCQDTYFQPNSYQGAGRNPDEIDGNFSCLQLGEQNSVWYTFQVETSGSLCFTIIPVDSLDDYDWAVFNLSNHSCAAIANNPSLSAACNFTYNTGCAGETGANGRTDCAAQFEDCLQVQAGEIFALNISNFSASNAGYTIDFSSSTAALYDQVPPDLLSVESFCSGVTVTFSERIACASVDPTDFTFTGPDGPYTIAAVQSEGCADSTGASRSFDLLISPAIQQAGTYQLALTGFVGDLCGNGANVHQLDVFMPLPPTASMAEPGTQCQASNRFTFRYDGPSAVNGYRWDFGDGAFSVQPQPTHAYEVHGELPVQLVITDANGCTDTATTTATVLPSPHAAFSLPDAQCEGVPLDLFNLSGPRGGSALTNYAWRMSDGTFFSERNPTHTFRQPGRFVVQLAVTNALGCADTLVQALDVHPQPTVAFDLGEDVCLGETVNLLNRSSVAGDSLAGWTWRWGDGTRTEGNRAPGHRYASGGQFLITLTVRSSQGCSDSLTQVQVVHEPEPPLITGDTVCVGSSAVVEALPSGGANLRWYRSEAGGEAFFQLPRYQTPPLQGDETYWVELTSAQGCDSRRVPVQARVFPRGQGQVLLAPPVLEFPDPTLQVSLQGDIPVAVYRWQFAGLDTSQQAQPSYTFSHPGTYAVRLEVVDVFGCTYRWQQAVEVRPLPPVFVPNVFTPNGDGVNDAWYVRAPLISGFEVVVYDRGGRPVYRSENADFRWTGVGPQGKLLPEGLYLYVLRGQDATGEPILHRGMVTLLH